MTGHLRPEMISSLLDEPASPGIEEDARRHLSECGQCRQEARDIEQVNSLLCGWFEQEILPPVPAFMPPVLEESDRMMIASWSAAVAALAVLSFAAWHQLSAWYSGVLAGLGQFIFAEMAGIIARLPAAAASIVNNPSRIENILLWGLTESSGLLAAFGIIYAISRQSRMERMFHETA